MLTAWVITLSKWPQGYGYFREVPRAPVAERAFIQLQLHSRCDPNINRGQKNTAVMFPLSTHHSLNTPSVVTVACLHMLLMLKVMNRGRKPTWLSPLSTATLDLLCFSTWFGRDQNTHCLGTVRTFLGSEDKCWSVCKAQTSVTSLMLKPACWIWTVS